MKRARKARSLDDYQRWTIESGLRHIGIGTANQVADYYRQYKRDSARILADMLKSGQALPVCVEGWNDPAFIHRDDPAPARADPGQASLSRA